MDDLTEKVKTILTDPHFTHSAVIGGIAFAGIKMIEKKNTVPPPSEVVRVFTPQKSKSLVIGLAVTGLAYMYMSKYGHNLPTTSE
jgi:hypothetical protein